MKITGYISVSTDQKIEISKYFRQQMSVFSHMCSSYTFTFVNKLLKY